MKFAKEPFKSNLIASLEAVEDAFTLDNGRFRLIYTAVLALDIATFNKIKKYLEIIICHLRKMIKRD
jgi:hypothetical protein